MPVIEAVNAGLRRVPTWPVYVVGALPPVWYFYLGLTGGLGAEPISEMEHRLGLLGLQFLLLGLAITPLRRFAGINLIRFRRAIGLLAFYYISTHLLTWLLLDIRDPARIWADIVKRPYITIGMAGFLLLVPLAATSSNAAVRRLGKRWRQLHWLVYPAVLLGAVHFVMLRKGWQIEPLVYLAIAVILLALRLRIRWVTAVMRPDSGR
ncbi:protein-methionine-sulfoxide reductase heme-binding subunit MsrQ [Maritimibacter sp. HL-12]|jgi:methionine sulfoxide reductase heme-binding subunit|uniref:protein-methionine-sulfoxide reductase heme-binding subunit MsrQ n=1 Tax=Maritimibacter sp. HL-12 TaxID=1162418 RepID=UPI000A0F38F2|nr:protein-methionine-sulfoxide reductase heme-binding subunit MsrQ [Maritimibacter sp. HL-12]SMH46429.1 sulfoxide reductase heme-binding subunit YedZ [Maritimibacter sp. HL-12]